MSVSFWNGIIVHFSVAFKDEFIQSSEIQSLISCEIDKCFWRDKKMNWCSLLWMVCIYRNMIMNNAATYAMVRVRASRLDNTKIMAVIWYLDYLSRLCLLPLITIEMFITIHVYASPRLAAQIAKFVGPTWGPPGSCRSQMGPCWPHESCYQGIVHRMTW